MSTFDDRFDIPTTSKAPVLGLIIMAICATVVGLVAGGLLSVLTIEVPYVKMRAIGPFLCGALAGAGVMLGGWLGKVRSGKARVMVALISGAVMMYFSWVVYLNLLLKDNLPEGAYLIDPWAVWEVIKLINETGVWEMFGGMLNGFGLTCFWILEAVIMLGTSIVIGLQWNPPFCDPCNSWTKKILEKPVYQYDPEDQIEERFKDEGTAVLDRLRIADPQAAHLVEVVVHQCPSCPDCNYLTLNHTPMKQGENGEIEKSTTIELVKPTRISSEDVEKVHKMSDLREAMFAAAPAVTDAKNEEAAADEEAEQEDV